MEKLNALLSGVIMPVILLSAGVIFLIRLRFFFILHPIRFIKTLKEASSGSGISPGRALSQALAGTLGVGNMAGVATAISSGGAGSIFWMILSAFIGMSVKYTEVALGVLHRRKNDGGFYGGAMYYIKDIFSLYFPKFASGFGGLFAILCIFNTLMTGNIVQMKAAAEVFPSFPPIILGGILACGAFIVSVGRASKVSAVTSFLIPFLCAGYMTVSIIIIVSNIHRVPEVMENILTSAFSFNSAASGIGGYAISGAIRYGVTRGIFSNEAGLGSSPTAHACANTKSPHHQGCFGIFEVFADTVILCSLTAFVILLSDGIGRFDGIPLTLYAFSSLAGKYAGYFIGGSVILFAFATLICSIQYGKVAVNYIFHEKKAIWLYYLFSSAATVIGSIINGKVMWALADFTVSLMTALNVTSLFFGFSQIKNTNYIRRAR